MYVYTLQWHFKHSFIQHTRVFFKFESNIGILKLKYLYFTQNFITEKRISPNTGKSIWLRRANSATVGTHLEATKGCWNISDWHTKSKFSNANIVPAASSVDENLKPTKRNIGMERSITVSSSLFDRGMKASGVASVNDPSTMRSILTDIERKYTRFTHCAFPSPKQA